MARSLIGDFVRAARSLLAVQVFIAVGAVALAGWTLAVTNQALRERDLLRERVIQLEASMAERGIVVPPTQTVTAPGASVRAIYPDAVFDDAARGNTAATSDLRQAIGDLFAPPPQLGAIVLHVRSAADVPVAQAIADQLASQGGDGDAAPNFIVHTMNGPDALPSGYIYFDGRQNRAAADVLTRFHDIARRDGVAPWSAQLRGQALPAQGEYRADRLDIILPPLPPPPAPPAAPPVAAEAPGGGR